MASRSFVQPRLGYVNRVAAEQRKIHVQRPVITRWNYFAALIQGDTRTPREIKIETERERESWIEGKAKCVVFRERGNARSRYTLAIGFLVWSIGKTRHAIAVDSVILNLIGPRVK